MIDNREENFNKYISLQDATKYCSYSQPYLRLRVRQGKLRAIKFGKNWVTTIEWLNDYIKIAENYKNSLKEKQIEELQARPILKFVSGLRIGIMISFVLFSVSAVFAYKDYFISREFEQDFSIGINVISRIVIERESTLRDSFFRSLPRSLALIDYKLINKTREMFKMYGLWLKRQVIGSGEIPNTKGTGVF